jgi:hypothetical protein
MPRGSPRLLVRHLVSPPSQPHHPPLTSRAPPPRHSSTGSPCPVDASTRRSACAALRRERQRQDVCTVAVAGDGPRPRVGKQHSQWRTSFRRDYALDGSLWYNVDARPRQGPEMDEDLEPRERAELLRHRCFVPCAKPHDDRWPYGLRLVEERG